jgi:hypothetical protein
VFERVAMGYTHIKGLNKRDGFIYTYNIVYDQLAKTHHFIAESIAEQM